MKRESTKNIGLALLLNIAFFIVEIIGGILTNSISIISDAIHDCGDTVALGASWILEKISERRPNEKYTYGYMRFSFLGALINSLILLTSCIVIFYETLPRFYSPQEVDKNGMLILSIFGIVFKGLGVYKTAKGTGISERAVSLHLLSDVMIWVATLVVSFLIKIFNVNMLDPLLSLGIVVFILINVVKNLKLIFEVLLERAPKDVDVGELKNDLLKNSKIINIHHIHMWLADGINTYSTIHVVVCDGLNELELSEIKKFVRNVMLDYNIGHVTIEIEFECERCKEDNCEFEMRGYLNINKTHHHHHH